ncbi:MAG: hypothetical protein K2X55_04800 [Burkholderiaceae bacterium]|nr:hypothetical protein [Burkholderiaceae bacterium]
MPAATTHLGNKVPDFLHQFAEPAPADLAAEVAALRRSVEDLAASLRPASAIITTGRDVLEQYKRPGKRMP